MSPASLALGTFAILSIILAATSGTEDDVTHLLEINITTMKSVASNSSTHHRTKIEENIEMKQTETVATNIAAPVTNERTSDTMKGNYLAGNPKITTAASISEPAAAVKEELKVSFSSEIEATAPHQERLIGFIDNTTNRSPEGIITSRLSRNESSSRGLSAPETSTTVVEASITGSSAKTISASTTIGTTQLTTSVLGKVAFKTRNDLVGGTFHEIKSGQKINGLNQGYIGISKIVKPNIASALGKYTPYFEDGQKEVNVTTRIGSTVVLDCEIGMLGNKTVTWSYHSADVIRLLTVGRSAYSIDQRISLFFRYPTNWRLRIQYATPRDSGLYECQVATFPPLVKKIHLLVTAPILVIMDDSGRIKSGERHLKAGSALRLRCEARDVPERYNETVIWTRGDEILNEDVSENRTAECLDGREIQVIVSTIVVEKATPRHAGNYSCVVPEKAKATVAVHVLNGELPAAVHDGNGVSKSVLNLWLVHLTVSYVFSR